MPTRPLPRARAHRLACGVAVVVVAALAGCTGTIEAGKGAPEPTVVKSSLGTLTVTRPLPGVLLPSRSVLVEGYVDAEDATEVTLNGAVTLPLDEQGHFSGSIAVAGDDIQMIEVGTLDLLARVQVEVDSIAPEIVFDSPAPGSFLGGEDIRFRGRVTDAHLKSFTIGSDPVRVDANGNFDQTMPVPAGAHHLRAVAVDEVGHDATGFAAFINGNFVSTYAMQPSSAVVKLGQNSLDAVADGIMPYLNSSQVAGAMIKQNPIVEEWWGRVDFLGESHGLATATVTPQNGYLDVTVAILNARIPYRLDHFLPGVITGDVTAKYIEGRVKASARVENGKPIVWINSLELNMVDFFVDMAGWPDVIDRGIVSDIARRQVHDSVVEHLAKWIPQAVNDALKDLPSGGDISVMGHTGTVKVVPSLLGISSKGIRAVVDINVRAKSRDWDLTDGAPGPLFYGHGAVPTSGTSPDIEAAVSLDIVNATAYAAWSTGGLSHRVDNVYMNDDGTPLNVGALALIVPGVRELASADSKVNVKVWAELPPVLAQKAGALVEVDVADLRVQFVANEGGSDVELFTLSVGASAPVSLKILNDTVGVHIGEYNFDADPVGIPPKGMPTGEELDTIILDLVKPYIEQYSEISGLRIPSLYGYKLYATDASLAGGYFRANGKLYVAK
ncbi:MAG: hypothetical protein R3A78_06025 [Polyangiales bacterium]